MDEELAHLAKADCSVWVCEPKLPIGWWCIKSVRLVQNETWKNYIMKETWNHPTGSSSSHLFLSFLLPKFSCWVSPCALRLRTITIGIKIYLASCLIFPCPVRDPCPRSQQFLINGKWARSWPNRRSPWSKLWCVSCYDMLEEYDYEQSTCSHDDLTV